MSDQDQPDQWGTGWGQQPPQPDQPAPDAGSWGQQPPPPGGQQPPPPGGQEWGQQQPPPPGGQQWGQQPPAQPPEQWGAQPAQPGGYGAQPPPPGPQWGQQPAQAAYGTPAAGGTGPYSIGDAFNYGWTKFQANVGPIILGFLGLVVIAFVIQLVLQFAVGGLASVAIDPTNPGGGGIVAILVAIGVTMFVNLAVQTLIQAGVTRGALAVTYGRPVEIGTLFSADQLPQVLLASLLIGVMAGIGFLLLFIPGLIVIFFTQYTVHFILDKRMSAVDAIKASFGFTNKNIGTLIGFFLASIVASFVGLLACGIGVLVAVPVVFIAQAYTYRRLQGEPVAA